MQNKCVGMVVTGSENDPWEGGGGANASVYAVQNINVTARKLPQHKLLKLIVNINRTLISKYDNRLL